MSLATMLESKGTLTRPSIGRDADNGVTQTFDNVVASDVPCSVQPSSASTQIFYQQRDMTVGTTIYFARDIGARPNDIFVVTERGGSEHTFQVRGWKHNLFARVQAPFQMDCEEIL